MRGPYKFCFVYVLLDTSPAPKFFQYSVKIYVSGKLMPLISVNLNLWGKEEVGDAAPLFFKSKRFHKLLSPSFPEDGVPTPAWVGWTAACPHIAATVTPAGRIGFTGGHHHPLWDPHAPACLAHKFRNSTWRSRQTAATWGKKNSFKAHNHGSNKLLLFCLF